MQDRLENVQDRLDFLYEKVEKGGAILSPESGTGKGKIVVKERDQGAK